MFYVKHLKKYIYLFILAALVLVIAHETFSCVMWDPDPRPGIEPGPPAGGAQSFSHWAREVRVLNISKVMYLQLCAACDYQAMLNATETRSFCGAWRIHSPCPGAGRLLFSRTAPLPLPPQAQEQNWSPALLAVFVCSSSTRAAGAVPLPRKWKGRVNAQATLGSQQMRRFGENAAR